MIGIGPLVLNPLFLEPEILFHSGWLIDNDLCQLLVTVLPVTEVVAVEDQVVIVNLQGDYAGLFQGLQQLREFHFLRKGLDVNGVADYQFQFKAFQADFDRSFYYLTCFYFLNLFTFLLLISPLFLCKPGFCRLRFFAGFVAVEALLYLLGFVRFVLSFTFIIQKLKFLF